MISADAVDQLCLWLGTVVPVAAILRWRWKGVLFGTLFVWALGIYSGIVLSALDPRRDAAMLDAIWRLTGWLGSGVYCLLILAARELVAAGIREWKRRSSRLHGGMA
ncbi:hypothetical protein EON77_04390 [bacterium]|nr:MAG: hypothetical protein EON77_04390 [bacterium]